MRLSTLLLKACFACIFILMFGLRNQLTADEPSGVLQSDQIESMRLYTPSGWYLMIGLDGSSTLGFGATSDDRVALPKGSLNSRVIFDMLAPHLLKENYSGKYGTASVSFSTGKNNSSFIIRNQAVTVRIFTAASEMAAKHATEAINNAAKQPTTRSMQSLIAGRENLQRLLRKKPFWIPEDLPPD